MTKQRIPAPPKTLSADAQARWRQIVADYSIEDSAGLLLLQTAMEAFDRLKGAQAMIAADGAVLTSPHGLRKAHPAIAIERDARIALLAALRALKLDLEPLEPRVGRPGGH